MQLKKCTTCKEQKPYTDFNKNKSRKDGYNNICKECSKKRSKLYYKENTEHHRKVTYARKKRLIDENKKRIFEYYKTHTCIDCPETNPIVLDFDHRDGVKKLNDISKLLDRSWKIIKREIDKCDVRCANCHRIRTAKQQGWYKRLIQSGYLIL